MHPCNRINAMNWLRMREVLAHLRHAKGMDVKVLAKSIGVKNSTVYRIEDMKKTSAVPRLQTVEAWLAKTSTFSLAHFFCYVEALSSEEMKGVSASDFFKRMESPESLPQISHAESSENTGATNQDVRSKTVADTGAHLVDSPLRPLTVGDFARLFSEYSARTHAADVSAREIADTVRAKPKARGRSRRSR